VLAEGLALPRRRRHALVPALRHRHQPAQIVTDGYAELTHPSVTVTFPLRGRPGESLLVWTTTPLDADQQRRRRRRARPGLRPRPPGRPGLLPLERRPDMLRGDYQVLGELSGRDMLGWTYDGPFDDLPRPLREVGGTLTSPS